MKKSSKKLQSTEVMVRIYDIFDGVDKLWVNGFSIDRTKNEGFGCYEFKVDTLLPVSIIVSNNCRYPSTIAMMESTGLGQVCIRGNEWGMNTARVPFNVVEFLFRALENTSEVVELVVAVYENIRMSK